MLFGLKVVLRIVPPPNPLFWIIGPYCRLCGTGRSGHHVHRWNAWQSSWSWGVGNTGFCGWCIQNCSNLLVWFANLMGKVMRLLWNWLWWVEEKHDWWTLFTLELYTGQDTWYSKPKSVSLSTFSIRVSLILGHSNKTKWIWKDPSAQVPLFWPTGGRWWVCWTAHCPRCVLLETQRYEMPIFFAFRLVSQLRLSDILWHMLMCVILCPSRQCWYLYVFVVTYIVRRIGICIIFDNIIYIYIIECIVYYIYVREYLIVS